MTEPLVRVRCGVGKCRQVMLEVYNADDLAAMKDEWAERRSTGEPEALVNGIRAMKVAVARPDVLEGRVSLVPCKRHDSFRGAFAGEVERRHEKGMDPRPSVRFLTLAWTDLAHPLYLAATHRRCESVTLTR